MHPELPHMIRTLRGTVARFPDLESSPELLPELVHLIGIAAGMAAKMQELVRPPEKLPDETLRQFYEAWVKHPRAHPYPVTYAARDARALDPGSPLSFAWSAIPEEWRAGIHKITASQWEQIIGERKVCRRRMYRDRLYIWFRDPHC